ncbi:MAG: hypothetical protein AMK72_00680 [Planctomycetes bacterium SM23_25]|nr:MAG: hypothetical protein AMK72_00680 [Planctomycetes bacterium SM23_25]
MSVTTDLARQFLDPTRQPVHPRCVVCREGSPCAPGLQFRALGDGSAQATLDCPNRFQGCRDCLHGGVVWSPANAAVTAELNVRFRHAIRTGAGLPVHARVGRLAAPLCVVEVGLVQEDQVRAKAVGKFMQVPGHTRR